MQASAPRLCVLVFIIFSGAAIFQLSRVIRNGDDDVFLAPGTQERKEGADASRTWEVDGRRGDVGRVALGERVAEVPGGKPDAVFLSHQFAIDDYYLMLNQSTVRGFESADMSFIEAYCDAWKVRIATFRRHLESRIPADMISPLQEAALRPFHSYSELAAECGDECVKVADVAIVIPVHAPSFNESWSLMESLLGQRVFPREIILVVSDASPAQKQFVLGFLTVVAEEYVNWLPPGASLRVYGSPSKHFAGDNRWYGFNQTTTSVVTFFDSDDYMHPLLVSFVRQAFDTRPELDHLLVKYTMGVMQNRSVRNIDRKVADFLRDTIHSETALKEALEYPDSVYEESRRDLPTWNKTWYHGNTDAEPHWRGGKKKARQLWHHPVCSNGWASIRRSVMKVVQYPVRVTGVEDSIFNYRSMRAGLNLRCVQVDMGLYLRTKKRGGNLSRR